MNDHHVWCNFWRGPVEQCPYCPRLFKLYPYNGLTPDELQDKYFPDAIKRSGT